MNCHDDDRRHRLSHGLDTAQKIKFSIKDFFSKCDQIRRILKKSSITEEILNGKLHFFCSESSHLKLPEKNRKETVNKRLIMVIKWEQ